MAVANEDRGEIEVTGLHPLDELGVEPGRNDVRLKVVDLLPDLVQVSSQRHIENLRYGIEKNVEDREYEEASLSLPPSVGFPRPRSREVDLALVEYYRK